MKRHQKLYFVILRALKKFTITNNKKKTRRKKKQLKAAIKETNKRTREKKQQPGTSANGFYYERHPIN